MITFTAACTEVSTDTLSIDPCIVPEGTRDLVISIEVLNPDEGGCVRLSKEDVDRLSDFLTASGYGTRVAVHAVSPDTDLDDRFDYVHDRITDLRVELEALRNRLLSAI